MSDSEDSAVTYTSVYTDSEPERVFWPVPQDEDEREPRFIKAHDPDFVPEPIYPEYIPLEDEHVLPIEEQPLPPVDSPTTESPGYVAESDPKKDPEYEDDEEQDGPVDYPMGEGDDGGDDEGDSSRDDTADEDEDMEEEEEDEEEEEEEKHVASADSTAVIPVVELVSLPEGTKPASVSLPSTVDVERLLALPTSPLSPLTSLSPPFAGERLARLTDPSVHPSPLLLPSSGCLTQTQALRITSTQTLTDAVTAALPSSSVDRKDEIPETEWPPRKKSCLFIIGSRDVGYGIRDTWIDPAEAIPAIAPTTIEEVNTRIVELAELYEHDIQDFHAILEDAQDVKKLEIELWNLKVRDNNIPAYTNHFQELALICTKFVSNETEKVD
nr:hypothetical protein [Tanacetum cinerariifolium]